MWRLFVGDLLCLSGSEEFEEHLIKLGLFEDSDDDGYDDGDDDDSYYDDDDDWDDDYDNDDYEDDDYDNEDYNE